MLQHWITCPLANYDRKNVIRQLNKRTDDKRPVTIAVPIDAIERAIPSLYAKLCNGVHDFDTLGDCHEVIIPKCASFADADRLAYATVISSAGWPYSVSEDYVKDAK